MAASTLLDALALIGAVLGDGLLEHFLAQGRGTLALLLNIPHQLPQLLLLLGPEFVSLGTEELPFELGNDGLSLGQVLRFLLEFLLGLGQQLFSLGGVLALLLQLLLQLQSIIG